ncbi:MAG: L-seryl-tRNA(Sec) selenium transferase [Nitriliruptorales bacterium]|nr:L-seryl-tRNA(Sec) selenium transferase [Nitriliruptorales bacterium]
MPALDDLADDEAFVVLAKQWGSRPARQALGDVLTEARNRERDGRPVPRRDELIQAAANLIASRRAGDLGHVINASGTILPGNLGRAPLSTLARDAVAKAAGYTAMGFDVETGRRASRTDHLATLLAELCGTEAAMVVNNGAAALLLVLTALSSGRDVIVSRGELVEVGATFRLPDLVPLSGARLCEVGTTNRTRPVDYRSAIRDTAGMLLKVHPSDYRFVGAVESTGPVELAAIAADHGIPFVFDVGVGLIDEVATPTLAGEPTVRGAIADGADLVVFSGDKLMGGPQAGIVVGRSDLIMRCRRHPLARALRIDKLHRAALEATVASHLRADEAPVDLPVWAMLSATTETLTRRARSIHADVPSTRIEVVSLTARVGGGTGPGGEVPSIGLSVRARDPEALARRLRAGRPPIIARAEAGVVLLDLRTVAPSDDGTVARLLKSALDDPAN